MIGPSGWEIHLEAFKIKGNDQIMLEIPANPNKVSHLRFISVGHPTIVSRSYRLGTGPPETPAIVPTANGFHFYIRMLPQPYREALASEATMKYDVKVDQSQIVMMTPDKFTCELALTTRDGVTETAKGEVQTFRRDPLKVDFIVKPYSRIYKELRNSTLSPNDVTVSCLVTKRAQHAQIDQLIITSQQIDQLKLENKLFGKADNTYVSRHQLNELGREVMQSLKIYESYESDGAFESNFVSDFLSKVGVKNAFTPTPIDAVLANLSPYNIKSDLRPDEIVRDYSDVFKVETVGDKQHIVANKESSVLQKEDSATSGGASLSAGFGKLGSVKGSATFAKNKSHEWVESGKSLDDQLKDINRHSESAVKFERKGLKIVPKSLDVAQLSRAQLSQSMSFGRIRRKLASADFSREIRLSWPINDGFTRKSCISRRLDRECERSSDCCEWNNPEYKVVRSCGDEKTCACVNPGDSCWGGFLCCDGSACSDICAPADRFHKCSMEYTPACKEGLTCTIDSVSWQLKLLTDDENTIENFGRCL